MLEGIRVLDLTSLLPGPYASLLLADMGAEVIKVESPLGDLMRQVPPRVRRRSAFFLAVNRNKRSLGLNFKKRRGRQLFLELVRHADVVLEGFRPGRAARLGIGPEDAMAANPRVVYCMISGYGQDGPDASRSGHDLTYLARGGVLDLNRRPDGLPLIPPIQIADLAAGTNAALAVCAALYARERTGHGQVLEVSMLESVVSWMGIHLEAQSAGSGARPGDMPLSGRYPFYNVYRTADGGHVALAAVEPLFWRDFCRAVGRPELQADQFAEGEARQALFEELRALFAQRTTDQWAALFREKDLAAEVVADLAAVLADPHLAARGALIALVHPEEGRLTQAACPVRVAGQPQSRPRMPPDLGADTGWVLTHILGLDEPTVQQLYAAGIVFGPDQVPRRMAPEELP